MRDGEDITLGEFRWVFQVALDQTSEQVFPAVAASALALLVGRKRPALAHLVQCDARDKGVSGIEERDEFPEGVLAEQVVKLRDLTDEAVVTLRVIDSLDGALDVDAGLKESEGAAKGDLTQHVEGKEVQPCPEIEDLAPTSLVVTLTVVVPAAGAVLGDFLGQHLDRVVNERAQLPHSGHAVGYIGDLLLLRVHFLADLREDVRVLRWREDGVEVRLVEPLPGREHVARHYRGRDRDLVRRDPHDGAVALVQVDVVVVALAPRRRYELPEAGARGQPRPWVFSQR